MSKGSRKTADELARCEAPAQEFVGFAKGLTAARASNRLRALADGPAAEAFAKRLVLEALGGSPHAVTCLKLIARFGRESGWAGKLHQEDASGQLPPAEKLKANEVEPVGRGIVVISSQLARPWIAGAYLLAKGAAAGALETLLLETAASAGTLAEALNGAVGTLQARGVPLTARVMGRCLDALEKLASPPAAAGAAAPELPLVQLARAAKRNESARLLAALLPAVLAGQADAQDAGTPAAAPAPAQVQSPASTEPAVNPLVEGAWSDADEALGRALRDMDLMARSFERLETAAKDGLAEPARKAKNATNLVLQWVRQAAQVRKVATLHKPGDRVPFDPAVHDLDGDAAMGALIRIVKPAIVRGTQPHQVVLLRAQAETE